MDSEMGLQIEIKRELLSALMTLVWFFALEGDFELFRKLYLRCGQACGA